MFFKCSSEEEGKKLYRRLAFKLHPDLGGDKELMMLLTEAYEHFLNSFQYVSKEDRSWIDTRIFDDDPRSAIIEKLRNHFAKNKRYQSKFFDSVRRFFSEKGFITIRQFESLQNMYERIQEEEKDNSQTEGSTQQKGA